MRRSITTEPTYSGYPIMTDVEKGYAVDKKILQAIKDQFEYAEQTKAKVFFMRMDVRFPQSGSNKKDNQIFSSFQNSLMKNLQRKGLKPQYLAVREQSREKHQHYHEMLLLDGNKTQNIHDHIKTADRIWNKQLDITQGKGLVDDCTHGRDGHIQVNGVMLRHDDPEYEHKKNDCFRRASYLAKVNTKSNTPQGQRELFSSHVPKTMQD